MVKKNLTAIICAAVGLFAFIFSAFEYIEEINAYDFFEEEFKMLKDFEISCAGIIPVIQVFIFIVGGLMLVCGCLAILKDLGKINLNINLAYIAKIMLAAMAVLCVLQLVFVIIFIGDFNDKFGGIGEVKIGFGAIFAVILSAGAFAADYVLSKKFAAVE